MNQTSQQKQLLMLKLKTNINFQYCKKAVRTAPSPYREDKWDISVKNETPCQLCNAHPCLNIKILNPSGVLLFLTYLTYFLVFYTKFYYVLEIQQCPEILNSICSVFSLLGLSVQSSFNPNWLPYSQKNKNLYNLVNLL